MRYKNFCRLFVCGKTGGSKMYIPSLRLLAYCGGLGAGIAYTMVRKMGYTRSNPVIVFYFSCFSCIICYTVDCISLSADVTVAVVDVLLLAGLFSDRRTIHDHAAWNMYCRKNFLFFDYSQIIFATLLGFLLFCWRFRIYSILKLHKRLRQAFPYAKQSLF